MNGKSIVVGERQIVIVPPDTTIENPMISPDCQTKFVFLTNRAVNDFLRQQVNVWNRTMYINSFKLRTLSDDELSAVYKMQDIVKMVLETSEFTRHKHEICDVCCARCYWA